MSTQTSRSITPTRPPNSTILPGEANPEPTETSCLLLRRHSSNTDGVARTTFTIRAVIAGLAIGSLVCMSNMYFGLQTGYSSMMSNASSLLGYAVFRLLRPYLILPFSAEENVLVQTVAGAAGCIPVTAGLLGVIPGIEYLLNKNDFGPGPLPYWELFRWSIGICFFGLIFAMLFRNHFVVQSHLPWPGPRATASLIKVLNRRQETEGGNYVSRRDSGEPSTESGEAGYNIFRADADASAKERLRILTIASVISSLATVLAYFIPIVRAFPIFGENIRRQWLWFLDLSPGFIGTGILTGATVPMHMLCGAIVGWGLLSPLAKYNGWATGDVDDWEHGSRGWIVWVSLAALLAECLVKLFWQVISMAEYPRRPSTGSEYVPINTEPVATTSSPNPKNHSSTAGLSTGLFLALLVSIIFCILTARTVFPAMPIFTVILATLLSLPLSTMGIRALGETDYNPMSGIGKISQFVFAVVIPRSNPRAVLLNMVAGALAEAGASQAGDLSYDLKVGYLVGSDLHSQLFGQCIGCVAGAFISVGLYRLYTTVYTVPGDKFQVPVAHIWVLTARMALGNGLPKKAAPFALGFGIIFAITTALKIRYKNQWLHRYIPGGVSFAIGIYNLPSFTIARVIGAGIAWYHSTRLGKEKEVLVMLACGLILGEGLLSIVNLALSAAKVPHL
ncbi:oligopeptide transporter-like protein [Zopfia rhizophila CBS 207.26]|uniref:Oligopeptide transporter-like protein n=1 Tax=Zopfia rhizophila CBS 207.26 TaxID=1314779 RepID=A0A6A6DA16_9PEZI|nr:oligopeptide transporter-like protein [Zopfia rhizophila CBS 207.26]